ncbi:hypothetical protein B5807_06797 [Epicoccum nigrum]|uniref:Uncharacterized protein n=1 Tax=Epicoccum nigrum TaxID=105696 RepID=A0A1Y2LYM6_EPING|nr:hypothetical protein B5807_06797 [Epicoccum nigrum]
MEDQRERVDLQSFRRSSLGETAIAVTDGLAPLEATAPLSNGRRSRKAVTLSSHGPADETLSLQAPSQGLFIQFAQQNIMEAQPSTMEAQPSTMEAQPRKRRKIQARTKRLVHGPLTNVISRIEPPQSLSELAKHLPDVANELQSRLDKLDLVERRKKRSDTYRQALNNEVKSHKNDIAAIQGDIVRLQENHEDEFLKQMQDAVSTPLPSPTRPASSPPPTPRSPRTRNRHDADILRMKNHLALPQWTSRELVDTEIARLVEAKNATRVHVQSSPTQSPDKRQRTEDGFGSTGADTVESHPNRKRRRYVKEQSTPSILVETGDA